MRTRWLNEHSSGDIMGYTGTADEYNGYRYGSAGREEVLKRLVERPELRKGVETALDTAERQQQSRGKEIEDCFLRCILYT